MEDSIYKELLQARGEGDDSGVDLIRRYDPQCLAGLKAFYADAVLARSDGLSGMLRGIAGQGNGDTFRSRVVLPGRGMERHLSKALDYGAKPREVLEFLETAAINAGIPILWRGSQALAKELEKRGIPFD